MLKKLVTYNFRPRTPDGFYNRTNCNYPFFIIKTCKRELVIGLSDFEDDCKYFESAQKVMLESNVERYYGSDAYQFLLEIICGLHSDILAEHEIVKQFKDAYASYRSATNRDTQLMKIIERLFMDSKDIRTKYLMKLGTNSYASLSRQLLFQEKKPTRALIIGSGNLAVDLLNQLKGKTELYLSARNEDAARTLCYQHGAIYVTWKDFEIWQTFNHIVNTIGAPITLFDHTFFEVWSRSFEHQCFIDLGYPSVVETSFGTAQDLYRLNDVVSVASSKAEQKETLVSDAKEAIKQLGIHRQNFFEKNC